MEYDLYFDESGKFDMRESTRNVVGGVMIPTSANEPRLVNAWNRAAQAAAAGIPGVTPEDLADYDFTHCVKNNPKPELRWTVQPVLLRTYRDAILQAGGQMILFDTEASFVDVDSTTTYLSILTKGLISLYCALQNEQPGEKITLNVHVGIREHTTKTAPRRLLEAAAKEERGKDNLTRSEIVEIIRLYQDKLYSPVAADSTPEINIDIETYRRMIRHLAFVIAPPELYGALDFRNMIDRMEILINPAKTVARRDAGRGQPPQTQRIEHAWTIPCDCICNSYYVTFGPKRRLMAGFFRDGEDSRIIHVDVTTEAILSEDAAVSSRNAYAARFVRLLNMGFPREGTETWLARFNAAEEAYRQNFVREIEGYFKAATYYHVDDREMLELLDHARTITQRIESGEIRAELQAHFALFSYAMHTHLGMAADIDRDIEAFEEAIAAVRNGHAATGLKLIFFNRNLVLYTDRFEFEKAEKLYGSMSRYWKAVLAAGADLLGREAGRDEEYGKEAGSYLQLLRHQLRAETDPESRDLLYAEAEEAFGTAMEQLQGPSDRSRILQSMSGVEQELRHWEAAKQCLLWAASLETGEPESLDTFWNAVALPEYKNPYLLAMYLRMIDAMLLAGEPEGAALLEDCQERLKKAFPHTTSTGVMDSPAMADAVSSIHPRVQILWRFASCVSVQGKAGWQAQGRKLFAAVTEQLAAQQEGVYRAIHTAVSAEAAAWALRYGDPSAPALQEAFVKSYKRFAGHCQELRTKDLFRTGAYPASPRCSPAEARTWEELMAFARMIAY